LIDWNLGMSALKVRAVVAVGEMPPQKETTEQFEVRYDFTSRNLGKEETVTYR
jgi:hypothetical protein